jgi:tRNA A37 threonylcarbamoyladenosine dehydratase
VLEVWGVLCYSILRALVSVCDVSSVSANHPADGIGRITVIDHDEVSVSNLHRQVLHTTERVGMNKATSASLAMKRYDSSFLSISG